MIFKKIDDQGQDNWDIADWQSAQSSETVYHQTCTLQNMFGEEMYDARTRILNCMNHGFAEVYQGQTEQGDVVKSFVAKKFRKGKKNTKKINRGMLDGCEEAWQMILAAGAAVLEQRMTGFNPLKRKAAPEQGGLSIKPQRFNPSSSLNLVPNEANINYTTSPSSSPDEVLSRPNNNSTSSLSSSPEEVSLKTNINSNSNPSSSPDSVHSKSNDNSSPAQFAMINRDAAHDEALPVLDDDELPVVVESGVVSEQESSSDPPNDLQSSTPSPSSDISPMESDQDANDDQTEASPSPAA